MKYEGKSSNQFVIPLPLLGNLTFEWTKSQHRVFLYPPFSWNVKRPKEINQEVFHGKYSFHHPTHQGGQACLPGMTRDI